MVAVLGMLFSGIFSPARADDELPPPLSPPNVVLIKTDDQVWDSMDRLVQYMPNLASFVTARGVSYRNSFVASPSCCQSRASTFVGRYPHNTGVKSQGTGNLLDTRGSIAAYLHGAGYRTGLFGKYLNLISQPPSFDEYTTVTGSCDNGGSTEFCVRSDGPAWYYNFLATRSSDGITTKITGDVASGTNYNTTWLGAQADDYLVRALDNRALTGQPFYLEFNPTAPHTHDLDMGVTMPEPQYRTSAVPGCAAPPVESDRSDKPAFVRAFPQTGASFGYRVVCPLQQRVLKSVDDWFGALVATLETSGQLDNTLVIFTSDNGLMFGEHALQRKFVAYDRSVRVPLMIAFPGVFAPGTPAAATAGTALVSNIDLLPTILSVTGIAPDPTLPAIDGHSLVTEPAGHPVLLSEYFADPLYTVNTPAVIPTWASVFDGRYRFIVTYAKGVPVTQELYDTVADPGELKNLLKLAAKTPSASYPVKPWFQKLNAQRTCSGTVATSALRPCS